jgi:hypothetical protein
MVVQGARRSCRWSGMSTTDDVTGATAQRATLEAQERRGGPASSRRFFLSSAKPHKRLKGRSLALTHAFHSLDADACLLTCLSTLLANHFA